jgi:hypothetical protein
MRKLSRESSPKIQASHSCFSLSAQPDSISEVLCFSFSNPPRQNERTNAWTERFFLLSPYIKGREKLEIVDVYYL